MGFWEDLTGASAADASNQAAQDTYAKQTAASGQLKQFGDEYAGQFKGLSTAFDPYTKAGGSALQQLMAGLGLGGDTAGFTNAYRSLPGYESGLQTGTDAAIRGANAGGMLQSGGTLKALQRYGSDYEDQRSGDYLDRLTGLAGQGQAATGAQTGLVGTGLQGQLSARTSAFGGDMNAAGTVGQGMVAGEQAKQSALTNLMGAGAYLGGSYLGDAVSGKKSGGGGFASSAMKFFGG